MMNIAIVILGVGVFFVVLLGPDNSYTTPLRYLFWIRRLCGGGIWLVVYDKRLTHV